MHSRSLALALVLALAGRVHADEVRVPEPELPHREALPRDVLASELADQGAAVERAMQMVADKVTAIDTARARRLHAASRVTGATTAPDDPIATARRVAAIRFVLQRDADDRAQLVDELDRLKTARARIATDVAHLADVAIPTELARPAHGPIVRHFGTLVHERSKATLSRRGLDFDVDARAPVSAPARGTVKYAGPIRGLDRGVIVDHGDYYSVIAKLGDIVVPVGATVEVGDRLGRAARHRVYFEVRVRVGPGGLPIDPEPLLHVASQTPPQGGKRPRKQTR